VHLLVLTELVTQFTTHEMNNMKHKIVVVLTVFISFVGFSALFCSVPFVFKATYVAAQCLCSFRTVIQPPSRIAIERLLAINFSWPVNVFGLGVFLTDKRLGTLPQTVTKFY
jgi:hypothetical protein